MRYNILQDSAGMISISSPGAVSGFFLIIETYREILVEKERTGNH